MYATAAGIGAFLSFIGEPPRSPVPAHSAATTHASAPDTGPDQAARSTQSIISPHHAYTCIPLSSNACAWPAPPAGLQQAEGLAIIVHDPATLGACLPEGHGGDTGPAGPEGPVGA